MEPHVTFHNVGSAAAAAVREQIVTLHDGTTSDSDPQTIECRGVRAVADYDEQARKLQVRIDVVPSIVTRGYVVGWLLDALIAAESEGDAQQMGGQTS
jgi:hypothetical protein